MRRPVVGFGHPGTLKGRLLWAWGRWKVMAHVVGNFQARLLLSLPYFLLIPLFALIVRTLMNPLRLHRHLSGSFWLLTLS